MATLHALVLDVASAASLRREENIAAVWIGIISVHVCSIFALAGSPPFIVCSRQS